MKVTIITPTFNSVKTLRNNLNAVARQTHQQIEHIFIDNCSTDGTLELLQTYPHISKIVSEPDGGIYDAMNKGIALATGDIIGILNSDDYLANENTIAIIAASFQQQSVEAVYGNLVYVHANRPEKIQRVWIAGGYDPKLFYVGWTIPHPTLYVRREVYEKYGTYNTNLRWAADYEMILRVALKHHVSIKPLREVLVYMQAGGSGNKNVGTRLKVNLEDRKAWKEIGLTPKWFTLHLKPVRKIWQFIIHYVSVQWLVVTPPAFSKNSYLRESNQDATIIHLHAVKNHDVI